ncbi:MAG: hypothetical protein IKM67_03815 [Clostridia bacterium]|nr:hypothetical protein [Clostridia bacterium]MBR3865825.1 hypothetical protein [Clostridia bacterium]
MSDADEVFNAKDTPWLFDVFRGETINTSEDSAFCTASDADEVFIAKDTPWLFDVFRRKTSQHDDGVLFAHRGGAAWYCGESVPCLFDVFRDETKKRKFGSTICTANDADAVFIAKDTKRDDTILYRLLIIYYSDYFIKRVTA